jgi:hypothetical protein
LGFAPGRRPGPGPASRGTTQRSYDAPFGHLYYDRPFSYYLLSVEYRSSGYVALQAEGHPVDFRNVRLLNLEGCMDSTASNYGRYYVKSDPSSCRR